MRGASCYNGSSDLFCRAPSLYLCFLFFCFCSFSPPPPPPPPPFWTSIQRRLRHLPDLLPQRSIFMYSVASSQPLSSQEMTHFFFCTCVCMCVRLLFIIIMHSPPAWIHYTHATSCPQFNFLCRRGMLYIAHNRKYRPRQRTVMLKKKKKF